MTIPFDQQRLSRDFVETIKFDQARGEAVSGEDLRCATEQWLGRPLPDPLRELFPAFSIPAIPHKGRPRNNRAIEDFGLKKLDRRYCALLREFRSKKDARSGPNNPPPSERAYRQLAEQMKDVFPGIDWRALRNKHSAWKRGRFHASEGFADSEDFDAEIERQFPSHK
jgi:hypothetical protein